MKPSVFRSIFRDNGLPSQLEYLKGRVRGDAGAIAWTDGKTLAIKWIPSIASAEVVADTQICGPVYARPGGIIAATDGVNWSPLPIRGGWAVGDGVVIMLEVDTDGTMVMWRGDA